MIWQGRQYEPYPIQTQDFEINGNGASPRPNLVVSNMFGLVTGMEEDLQSIVGASVVRHQVYRKFLDVVNFVDGNPDVDPEQEAVARYSVEQLSELTTSAETTAVTSEYCSYRGSLRGPQSMAGYRCLFHVKPI